MRSSKIVQTVRLRSECSSCGALRSVYTLTFSLELNCKIITTDGNSQSFIITKPQGYKTFFMLKSAELEIYPAHKC